MTIKLQLIDEKAGDVPFSLEIPNVTADEVIERGMATPGTIPVIRALLKHAGIREPL